MTKKRVGVTGNSRRWSPSWWCTALSLKILGAIPERISIRHTVSGKPFDAIIIGGGDDISPEHYNGDIQAKVKVDPKRDELEISWINWALNNKIPMLGICRGAQLINVVLGGTLHQDIRPIRKYTRNRPGVFPTKTVVVDQQSVLFKIMKKTNIRVNSLHHQAVNFPGKNVRVIARDLDDITQAIEYENNPNIIGVQWHPEYLFYMPSQLGIFKNLILEH